MRIKRLQTVLEAMIKAGRTVLMVSAPGVGKTEVAKQTAKALKADMVITHPPVEDPTNTMGLPWPDATNGHAHFLPFGQLKQLLEAKKKTVWLMDDLGQASMAVQAANMQWLLARRCGEHKLPDCVSILAATNRRTDRAGVSGILEPVKSRFQAILTVETHIDDWTNWAVRNGIRPEIIAFLRTRPELLQQFTPTADMVNQPCPRTWQFASQTLDLNLPHEKDTVQVEIATATPTDLAHLLSTFSTRDEALAGAVGVGAAAEFSAYLRTFQQIPNLDSILMNPATAQIPTDLGALYAVVTGLATKANQNNFSRIVQYAERLVDADKAEFGVVLIRDCDRRDPKIQHTAAWDNMCADSEIAALVSPED